VIRSATKMPESDLKESIPRSHPFPKYLGYTCDYPQDATLLDMFADGVVRNPEAPAVRFAGRSLTYADLDHRSTLLANYLNTEFSTAAFIPIFMLPSPEMIIGILGILKSGKAYVPIDTEFPRDRVRHILTETAAPVIISDQASVSLLDQIKTEDQTVCVLDNPDEICWEATSSHRSLTPPKPDGEAYIIYTSGSSGTPKGTVITHRALVDYFFGLKKHVPVWNTCRSFALGSSFATDLGNTVLFGALISAGCLHVFRKERFNDSKYIKDYFEKHQIDCLKIVPSHWKYLSDTSSGLYPKKLLIFGGEVLPAYFIQTVKNDAPSCTIVNHYGPTETTIGKLLHVVDTNRDYGTSVPIGTPFSN